MTKQLTTEQKFLLASNQFAVLRGLGYSAADLRGLGYSAAVLRDAGYSAAVLRDAGYSAADLRDAGYSAAVLRGLGYSAADLRGLGYSAADLRGLGYSAAVDEWLKDVPLLVKPYSSLLADIQAKKRIHRQSTFGPEDFDPERNVCKTPMCTAGHFVQMAGPEGWKLKLEYGWAGAAALLHMKAHPDVPPQNFGAIPQDWALAYIETMAAKEAAGNAP